MSLPTSALADGDTVTLDPIEVTAPSEDCGGRTGSFCSSGGGGGGGGSDTGGSGSDSGFGGGGGGATGQLPHQGPVLPRSPGANDDVNCESIGEVRWAYADVEVTYSRMNSGTRGNALNGVPLPGTAYTIRFANGEAESYIAGPYGSPTLAGGEAIPGTCHQ